MAHASSVLCGVLVMIAVQSAPASSNARLKFGRPDNGGIDDQISKVRIIGPHLVEPPPNPLDALSTEMPEHAVPIAKHLPEDRAGESHRNCCLATPATSRAEKVCLPDSKGGRRLASRFHACRLPLLR